MARQKLGEILVQRGVLDAATLKRALGEQIRFASQKLKIGQILVDMKACTWDQVCQALSEQLSVPFADLGQVPVNDDAVRLVPVELCEKWKAVAFRRDPGPPEMVAVALADPADVPTVDALRSRVGKRLQIFLGAPDRIQEQLDRVFRGIEPVHSAAVEVGDDDLFSEDAPMAIEHYEAGSVVVPEFDPAAPIAASEGPAIALDTEFDSVFGKPPPSPTALHASSTTASMSDPFAGLGLGGPAAVPAPEALAMLESQAAPRTPRAEITHFPDRRVKEAPPPPPPTGGTTKPTLVLTSDALFGPATESAVANKPEPTAAEADDIIPELTGEVLPDEEVVEAAELEADLSSAPADSNLFGSNFDAADHADPAAAPLAPEPGASLFGSSFHADHAGEGVDPMPELSMAAPVESAPPPVADDVDLEELIPEPPTMDLPVATAVIGAPAEAVASAPAATDGELIDIFDDVAGEPEAGSAPLTAQSIEEPPTMDLPPLPDLASGAGAVPPPAAPAAPKLELPRPAPTKEPEKVTSSPKLELPKPAATKEPEKVTSSPKLELPKPPAKPAAKVDGSVPPSPEKWTVVTKGRVDGEKDAKPSDAELASFADRPLTPEELDVIETIEQLADGVIDEPSIKQAKPAHMIAALVRLLIRRGVIQETDFLEELTRK